MRHFLSQRVVLAVALLAAQFGSLAHLALIRHADALDAGACSAAAHGIDEATEGARFELQARTVSLHTADGCAVLAHSRVSFGTPVTSLDVVAAVEALSSLQIVERAQPVVLSPLIVAPKNSPPARG